MKILAFPVVAIPVHAAENNEGQRPAAGQQFDREHYAPNILKGYWELRPEQKRLLPRLRCNKSWK